MRRYPWSYQLFLATGAGWISVYVKFPFDMGNLPSDNILSLIVAGIILIVAIGGVVFGPIVFMVEFAAARNKDEK